MRWLRGWFVVACLGWAGATFAVEPPAPPAFVEALRATRLGPQAAAAFKLVQALNQMGLPQQAEGLRRELFVLYVQRLDGAAPEPGLTLGAAIDRGLQRPPPGPDLMAAWQRGYRRAIGFEWRDAQAPLPAGLAPYVNYIEPGWLRRAGPGLWILQGGNPTQLLLALRVRNESTEPVPLFDPTLALAGAAAATPLACGIDPQPRPSDSPVVKWRLGVGGARDLLCRTADAEHLAERLSVLVEAARQGGAKPLLQVPDLADAATRERLEAMLRQPDLADVATPWLQAWKRAKESPDARWQPAAKALGAPTQLAPLPTAAQRAGAWFAAMQPALMGTALALGVFAFMRVLGRFGLPAGASLAIGLVPLAIIAALTTARVVGPDPTAGDGWNRPIVHGAVVVVGFGMVFVGVLLLVVLHRVLDQEGTSWLETVLQGWTRMLDWQGEATRGEFWGFVAHAAWLWGMANSFAGSAKWGVLLLLLPPLIALVLRRLRAVSMAELATGGAVLILWAISLRW